MPVAGSAGWYLASQLISLEVDCNDTYAPINPGASEIGNAVDDDCSGSPESPSNTWTGAGGNNLWSNAGNWTDGIVPLTCQHLVIPAGKTVTVEAEFQAVGKTLLGNLGAVLNMGVAATMLIKN